MAEHKITTTTAREAVLTELNDERDRLGALNALVDENGNPVVYVPLTNAELLQTFVDAALDLRIQHIG